MVEGRCGLAVSEFYVECGTGPQWKDFWVVGMREGMNETIFLISEVCYHAGLRGGTLDSRVGREGAEWHLHWNVHVVKV